MRDADQAGSALMTETKIDRLAVKVRAALSDVPTEASLADRYTDLIERRAAHGRAIMAAVLDALFFHEFDYLGAEPESGCVVEVNGNDALSALAAVRLDFLHDKARLDNGLEAELVLRRASAEAAECGPQIAAQRKALLDGILLINLWFEDAKNRRLFGTERKIRLFVAEKLGRSAESVKTSRSYLGKQKRFSKEELDYYRQREKACRFTNAPHSSFELFLPAFAQLCSQAYPRQTSASTSG
jgi:hypothetical protein